MPISDVALHFITKNYPPETWTHVYTDGSATKAITDGGAGIIVLPQGSTVPTKEQKQRHLSRQQS